VALRYCTGWAPLDIADIYGASPDEATESVPVWATESVPVWVIVDAIHKAPQLEIKYPERYHPSNLAMSSSIDEG
jgi:hypothetical protein